MGLVFWSSGMFTQSRVSLHFRAGRRFNDLIYTLHFTDALHKEGRTDIIIPLLQIKILRSWGDESFALKEVNSGSSCYFTLSTRLYWVLFSPVQFLWSGLQGRLKKKTKHQLVWTNPRPSNAEDVRLSCVSSFLRLSTECFMETRSVGTSLVLVCFSQEWESTTTNMETRQFSLF